MIRRTTMGHITEIFQSQRRGRLGRFLPADSISVKRMDRLRESIAINNTDLVTVTGIGEDSNGDIWISSGYSFPGAFRWGRSSVAPIFGTGPMGSILRTFIESKPVWTGGLWFLGNRRDQRRCQRTQGTGCFCVSRTGGSNDGVRRKGCSTGVSYAFTQNVRQNPLVLERPEA